MMGKPGPDDVKIEETKPGVANEESEDEDVVNPGNIPLNVIKNDLKENEIPNDINEDDIKEVKTILSDDEKFMTGGSDSDRT